MPWYRPHATPHMHVEKCNALIHASAKRSSMIGAPATRVSARMLEQVRYGGYHGQVHLRSHAHRTLGVTLPDITRSGLDDVWDQTKTELGEKHTRKRSAGDGVQRNPRFAGTKNERSRPAPLRRRLTQRRAALQRRGGSRSTRSSSRSPTRTHAAEVGESRRLLAEQAGRGANRSAKSSISSSTILNGRYAYLYTADAGTPSM